MTFGFLVFLLNFYIISQFYQLSKNKAPKENNGHLCAKQKTAIVRGSAVLKTIFP